MEKWKPGTILKFPALADLVSKNREVRREGKKHHGREEGDTKEMTALKC